MKRIYDSNGQPVDDYRAGGVLWSAGQNEIHTWYAHTDQYGRLWQVIQNRFENTGAWFAYVMPMRKAHRVLNMMTRGFDGTTHGPLWHVGQQNPLKLIEAATPLTHLGSLPTEVRAERCPECPQAEPEPEQEESARARLEQMTRQELIEALELVAMAGSFVVASWEGGDLAGAVNELRIALDDHGVFYPMDDEKETTSAQPE